MGWTFNVVCIAKDFLKTTVVGQEVLLSTSQWGCMKFKCLYIIKEIAEQRGPSELKKNHQQYDMRSMPKI